MSHPDPDLLERYVDGELSRRRRRDVETHVEGCDGCASAVGELRRVGALVRMASEDAAAEASLDGLADAVLEAVQKDERPLPWSVRARTWLGEFARYQKKIWVPPLAAAGAAAAALLIVVGVSGPAPTPDAPSALPPGSNVLSVSFGSTVDGSLFLLEGKDGTTTAVIWVDEGESEPVPEVKHS